MRYATPFVCHHSSTIIVMRFARKTQTILILHFFREKTAFEVELYNTSMYYNKHSKESCTFFGSKKLYYPGLLYDLSVLLLYFAFN